MVLERKWGDGERFPDDLGEAQLGKWKRINIRMVRRYSRVKIPSSPV